MVIQAMNIQTAMACAILSRRIQHRLYNYSDTSPTSSVQITHSTVHVRLSTEKAAMLQAARRNQARQSMQCNAGSIVGHGFQCTARTQLISCLPQWQ